MNRSQSNINKNVDMISAPCREREYFANTLEYKHLAQRTGSKHLAQKTSSKHLAKMLSKHLETIIKSRIPSIQSLINKTITELEIELSCLGKRIADVQTGSCTQLWRFVVFLSKLERTS